MKSKLDFSQFHALDHYPWQAECRATYGGPRIHMKYWWGYKGNPKLHRYITCLVGRHHKTTMTGLVPSSSWPKVWQWKQAICTYCLKPLGPKAYNPDLPGEDSDEVPEP